MLCLSCGDVVQMRPELRSCACGASSGHYLDDCSTVEQTEGSISLALHNHDLRTALDSYAKSPDAWHPLMVFRAYVNPRTEPDVRYVPAGKDAEGAGQPATPEREPE